MDHVADAALKLLPTYGPGGVIALLAISALVFVWRHSANLAKDLAASNKARAEDAERRFQEVKVLADKATEGLVSASRSMTALSAEIGSSNLLNEQRLMTFQTMAGQVATVAREIERMGDKIDAGLVDLRVLSERRA